MYIGRYIVVIDFGRLLSDNPAYARLWIAQAVSLIGDWFTTIALSALTVQYNKGAVGIAISGLLLARFLPPVIVGSYAGILADRFDRKRLLIFSDFLRIIIVLMFLFVTSAGRLWLLYSLVSIQFMLSALFEIARSAYMPSVVAPRDIIKANLLSSSTWSAMLAIGAVVGGLVTSMVGLPMAFCIDACSFALSALLILSIQVEKQKRNLVPTSLSSPTLKSSSSMIDSLRYIARRPKTAIILFVKLSGNIGSDDLLMVVYGTLLFIVGKNGTVSLGFLYGAFGIGAVLGPLLFNRFNDNSIQGMRRLICIGFACMSFAWFLFGIAPTLLIAGLALLIRAMGSASNWSYSSAILQKEVPNEYLGRVFALDNIGLSFITVISAFVMGWCIDHLGMGGIRYIVISTGLISILPTIFSFLRLWGRERTY